MKKTWNPQGSARVRKSMKALLLTVASLTTLSTVLAPMATAAPQDPAGSSTPMTVQQVLERDGQALKDTGLLELAPPEQAKILTTEDFKANAEVNTAFVRLDNHRVNFMVKDAQGHEQELFPFAVETGFWDSLACGGVYASRSDKLFSCVTNEQSPFYANGDFIAGMKKAFTMIKEYGFNTVQITVNWAEWDRTMDPAHPNFDFAVLDDLKDWAKEAGLKVLFVLFFQVQRNMPAYETGFRPSIYPEDEVNRAGKTVYHLADENGISYGIQWANQPVLRTVEGYTKLHNNNAAVPELYPEFWHPVIHKQITTALTKLAEHFRTSKTVIGYQVGNETGVTGGNDYNYYDDPSTANPYYQAMFELWKQKTGSSDKVRFRKELGIAVWQSMVKTMRAQDPYKLLTTNFQSSDVDKNPTNPRNSGGQDLNFYRDAGLDVIAPMFYGGTENIRKNIDQYYDSSDNDTSITAQELPGYFPSEIGIGWNRGVPTQSDILGVLARGGVGFGLYSMGEMLAGASKMQKTVRSLLEIMNANESLLWSGQPVSADTTDNIHLTTADSKMTLTTLQSIDPNKALGIMWIDYGSKKKGTVTARPVTVHVREAGTYKVEIMENTNTDHAVTLEAQQFTATANSSFDVTNIQLDDISGAFIKVTKVSQYVIVDCTLTVIVNNRGVQTP